MYIALSFAPTELGFVCDRCSYKHSAPTELTRLVAALPRCENFRVLCVQTSLVTSLNLFYRHSETQPGESK